MKDGFVGQRRFVGHKKKNHFWIIVVCMKYKCQRGHAAALAALEANAAPWTQSSDALAAQVEAVVVVVDMRVMETMVVVEK